MTDTAVPWRPGSVMKPLRGGGPGFVWQLSCLILTLMSLLLHGDKISSGRALTLIPTLLQISIPASMDHVTNPAVCGAPNESSLRPPWKPCG